MRLDEPFEGMPQNVYGAILQKALAENIPIYAYLELTYRCNLSCVHCYVVSQPDRREFSTEEVKEALDQLADLGTLYIAFTGGEILTRPDFFEVARYARKKQFALRLFTNGTLITPQVADQIKVLYPLDVEVSVYGACPSVHDAVTTKKGSFESTLRGICLLRERDIPVIFKTPVLNTILDELQNIKALARDMGARLISNPTLIPDEAGSTHPLTYRLSDEDLMRYYARYFEEEESPQSLDDPPCGAGRMSLTVSPFGDIFPCQVIRTPIGNLRERSLRAIWAEPEGVLLGRIRALRRRDFTDCTECPYWDHCTLCIGMALSEGKDVLSPSDEVCRQAKCLTMALQQQRSRTPRRKVVPELDTYHDT